jgi:hypothetical protein
MTLKFFEHERTYQMPISKAVHVSIEEPPEYRDPGYEEATESDSSFTDPSDDDDYDSDDAVEPSMSSGGPNSISHASAQPHQAARASLQTGSTAASSPAAVVWGQSHGIADLFSNQAAEPYPRFPALLINFSPDDELSPINVFMHLLPIGFLQRECLPAINQGLSSKHEPVCSLREFLLWIALRLAMTLFRVSHLHDYWATQSTSLKPALDFGMFGMARDRFKRINSALRLTISNMNGIEMMHHVCREFNEHMKSVFKASWLTCIDESMCRWTNKFTAPIWHWVPRKPCPGGFEFKDIACAESKIIFGLQLVDKNAPAIPGIKRMASLQLKLTEAAGMWGTPRVLVGDSAFVSVQAARELLSKSIHTIYTVKKKKHWPAGVDAEALSNEMLSATGEFDKTIPGKLRNVDGSSSGINLTAHKSKITTILLSNALRTTNCVHVARDSLSDEDQQDDSESEPELAQRTRALGSRPEVVDMYCRARHAIDDSNNLRMGSNSIEGAWETRRWQSRIMAFIIGVCEANAYCAVRYFSKKKIDHLEFRRQLSLQLIESMRDYALKPPKQVHHELRVLPQGKKWRKHRWVTVPTCKNPQLTCRGCFKKNKEGKARKTTTYCACDPRVGICETCFYSRHLNSSAESGPAT